MTDLSTNEEQQSVNKKPTHTLFATNSVNGNMVRLRVGVAWKHKKGNGFNIALDNLVAFENKVKEPENVV